MCPIPHTIQVLGNLTVLRALTGEEEVNWRVAVVAGLAALGRWLLDLDLSKE